MMSSRTTESANFVVRHLTSAPIISAEVEVVDSDSPVAFGYKIGWFAIHSTDRDAVVRSLQLSDPTEVTWKAGIQAVYKDAYKLVGRHSAVFVSPPVIDWTFVVGDWTMGNGEEQGVHKLEQ